MLPSGRVRLRRRAWCSSISASSPWTSGSSTRRRQLAGQSDRLGREVDVARVALVEDEVQHPHHRAHVAGAIDTGRPTVRLARLMRWAIVLSGTR